MSDLAQHVVSQDLWLWCRGQTVWQTQVGWEEAAADTDGAQTTAVTRGHSGYIPKVKLTKSIDGLGEECFREKEKKKKKELGRTSRYLAPTTNKGLGM